MSFQPGQSGCPGGRAKEKPWREAIQRAVKRQAAGDMQALDRAADSLVTSAIAGDLQAMKEIGDRLDGKPVQQQVHTGDEDGGAMRFERIERVIVDPKARDA